MSLCKNCKSTLTYDIKDNSMVCLNCGCITYECIIPDEPVICSEPINYKRYAYTPSRFVFDMLNKNSVSSSIVQYVKQRMELDRITVNQITINQIRTYLTEGKANQSVKLNAKNI